MPPQFFALAPIKEQKMLSEQKIILFHFGNQFNKRWLYVSGLDVLGQSHRHNICAFIELPCYLNCFIKIAYIMLNKYSDSDSNFER